MKKFAAILACIYLAAHLSACTSKESREDDGTSVAEETAEVDSELAEVEDAQIAGGDETNSGFVDDQLPEQALGEQPPTDTMVADAGSAPMDGGADVGGDSGGFVDSGDMPVADAPIPEMTPEAAPDTSSASSALADNSSPLGIDPGYEKPSKKSSSSSYVDAPSTPPVQASLKKVEDAPFDRGGQLLNAVYIARPGDTYKKIAMNIYGDSARQKDLKSANPSISKPKAGDKIYFNSPQRPTDRTAMRTFYEDMGMTPEVYVAKDGDNLRTVADQLLGYKGAWKEVWVTNRDVESKSTLMAGTELRYWKSVPSVAPVETNTMVAQNPPVEMAPSNPVPDLPPPQQDFAAAPPAPDMPPPPDMAMNDFNAPPQDAMADLPPPPDAGMAGTMADAPPPPPPADMAPPPPPPMEAAPPPPPMAQRPPQPTMDEAEGLSNDDMMMGLAAVGILAAGVAGIMVARKRRQQKEMAAAFGDTQVGAS